FRQAAEMLAEMALDLPLRLDHEPEAGPVTGERRDRTNKEGAGVPQRVEQAGTGMQVLQAALAPGEVIGLLAGRIEQHPARSFRAGGDRLAMVERLGGDLAGMVDAHQR